MPGFVKILFFLIIVSIVKGQGDEDKDDDPPEEKRNITCPPEKNPTELMCDFSHPCPTDLATFACIQGQCRCPGNNIFSMSRCKCTMPAGGQGCRRSGDCTDGAHCYHPNIRCRGNRWHSSCRQKATQCHCCDGPLFGDESTGVCPPSRCLSGGSKLSTMFVDYFIAISSLIALAYFI